MISENKYLEMTDLAREIYRLKCQAPKDSLDQKVLGRYVNLLTFYASVGRMTPNYYPESIKRRKEGYKEFTDGDMDMIIGNARCRAGIFD